MSIIMFLKGPHRGMRSGRKYGAKWSCYYFLFEKKIAQRFVQ
jgi:hypothetical protein